MAGKRVAIVQSNYVPWRGYFDMIGSVDEFILLDDAQYTRRDWRNRNRIKSPQGSRWLTISVQVSGRYTQSIHDTLVADEEWSERHWDILRQQYAQADGFAETAEFVQELYGTAPGPRLTDVNRHFLTRICVFLGIETPITLSLDYDPEGTRTERLVDLAAKAGATEYVSGPAAKAYLEEEQFAARGIDVSWFSYPEYAGYEQVHPPYDPRVSILDLILCTGGRAPAVYRATQAAT